MKYVTHLCCRECSRQYDLKPLAACEECWAPLEVIYDYDRVRSGVTPGDIALRPPNMWRYRELLPLDGDPVGGLDTG
ncbi:MAG: threonine synthase, partial [Terriglobia bacterium]